MAEKSLLQRIVEFFTDTPSNLYGRVRSITRRWRSAFRAPHNDWARSDYQFWRNVYGGRAAGLELSGLLVKPVVSKLAGWTLGRAPRWKLESERSQEALAEWWGDHHADILAAWRGALKEGDAFVVVNADLSLTLLPPDCVDPIVDDNDYGRIAGWRVTQTLAHPERTERMSVVDEYYADRRVQRVESAGRPRRETVYPNLLGRVPLVHIANQSDAGQVFGRAEAEPLLGLLHKYGEVLEAAVEGNVLQGRPTPVLTFETVADMKKFDEENASFETQTLPDGRTQTVKTYDVDLSQLIVASGATFEYKAPGNFTGDTAKLLELMFYLLLEHSELPEFVMGNAIASSKASADVQMPIFVQFIAARRGEMAQWLTELAEIALAYLALTTPGVTAETPTLQWELLDQEDGTLTLDAIEWLYLNGLIDELTALQLVPVEIEDAEAVLAKAKEERATREAEQMDADEQAASVVQDVINRMRGNGALPLNANGATANGNRNGGTQ